MLFKRPGPALLHCNLYVTFILKVTILCKWRKFFSVSDAYYAPRPAERSEAGRGAFLFFG